MSEGDTIKLYYDPLNPKDVRDKEHEEGQFPALIVVGAIFIIVGTTASLWTLFGGKMGSGLMKNGIRCKAEEFCVDRNYNVKVNGRHPYVVYCRVYDPRVGVVKEFKSKNCYENIEKYDIEDIDVYLHPEKMNKYYVDIQGAIKNASRNGRKNTFSV